jgi:peptidyl-prolyl cis-trans isomerase B (cyclophilin B)
MKRPSLLLVGSLAALAVLAAGPATGVPERPEVELTLTADRSAAILGEAVQLTVQLHRKRGKPTEVNAVRLARNSMSLEIAVGERKYSVSRIFGDLVRDGENRWMVRDAPSPRGTLRRGRPLEFRMPFYAILEGKLTLRAVYRGFDLGPEQVVSPPLTLTITPPPTHRELTATLRTSEGALTLALYPQYAFNTVFNFVTLARAGRYDGLTFHRIIPGFLIQGGDPKGNGLGGPGWTIPAEFHDELKHEKGTVSMAKAEPPDSAGSQFFIMLGTDLGLDGKHTAFGRVVEGLNVLDRLAAVELVSRSDGKPPSKPLDPPVIQAVEIGTR